MKKGKFIVITGTDGSGKATQAKMLVDRLRENNIPVETIDFPQYQNNFFGKLVGRYLTGEFGSASEVDPHLASVLYAADRFESKAQIEKWLSEGKIIIADRYASDNQIHQGGKIANGEKREEFLSWLEEMEFKVFNIPKPDAIIYLDMPLEISQELMKGKSSQDKKTYLDGKKDIHENDLEHMANAKKNALELVQKKNNWIKIDCAPNEKLLSVENISEIIYGKIKPLIDKRFFISIIQIGLKLKNIKIREVEKGGK